MIGAAGVVDVAAGADGVPWCGTVVGVVVGGSLGGPPLDTGSAEPMVAASPGVGKGFVDGSLGGPPLAAAAPPVGAPSPGSSSAEAILTNTEAVGTVTVCWKRAALTATFRLSSAISSTVFVASVIVAFICSAIGHNAW